MARTVIGGLVGGLIIFAIGFIFWATPLAGFAFKNIDEASSAAVQTSLAQNLTKTGTGTYVIPAPNTAGGTVLYGQGPIATIHFNTSGFPVEDPKMIGTGLAIALITGLLMAFGLAAVSSAGFAGLGRLVVLYALGFTVWEYLATPVFNHFGWGHWIYAFVAETVSLITAGLVIARWFVPRSATVEPSAEPVRAD
jgi:hypothetical protein